VSNGLIRISAQLALETRRKRSIPNEMNRIIPDAGLSFQVEHHKRDYPSATHRNVGPCRTFNCHGLTFASRRTWLHGTYEIQMILDDDDYILISVELATAGDIIIYRKNSVIEHSGIVVQSFDFGDKLVLSKWGPCQEVIHKVRDCPYREHDITYYRIAQ
jgi:hypothetical protein